MDSVRSFRETEIQNTAGIQHKPGNVPVRIPGKPHGPNLPSKNVSHSWSQYLSLVLQPNQTQLVSVQHTPVHRINLLAYVCAREVSKLDGDVLFEGLREREDELLKQRHPK